MRHLVTAFLPSFLFLSSFIAHAASVEVQPIVKEGTPGDLLMQDPIVPSQEGSTRIDSGTGTIQRSLSDQVAVPITGTGVPGTASQFRGLGRSAEDTDVQTLGVPLNPPQGGGFDLSVFPQFIWSAYEYQAGPALGTFDPRGTAGSLTLVPWTARALTAGASSGRVAGLGATANVFQVSGAASDGKTAAVVAGSSSGDAQGPSAAFSGRWGVGGGRVVSVHFLLTDLDVKTPGPNNITPNAHQRTVRGIPLLQLDAPLGHDGLLKSSVFYDVSYLRYDDPSLGALPATQDHSFQLGTENALLWGNWKFGAGVRGVRYQTLAFEDQSEAVGSLLASRSIELGEWLIEPTVRGVGVSRYGVLPEGSIGVRYGDRALAWFARTGFSRHFPSLVNRFYSYPGFPGYPGFAGNPGLSPEKDWTATTGVEMHDHRIEASVQLYGQYAQDTQARVSLDASTDTLANAGNARIGSLLANVQAEVSPWLDLRTHLTLSASKLSESGFAFPGLPGFLGVLGAVAHSPGENDRGLHRWEARVWERVSSTSVADKSGNLLPAYHQTDIDAQVRVDGTWIGIARMEDVFDQKPQLVAGYPGVGRVFSVLISKEL